MKGLICLWSGAIVDIPAGWLLCDGNDDTPDLRDKFIVGAGLTYSPDETAGTNLAADSGCSYYALCFIIKK